MTGLPVRAAVFHTPSLPGATPSYTLKSSSIPMKFTALQLESYSIERSATSQGRKDYPRKHDYSTSRLPVSALSGPRFISSLSLLETAWMAIFSLSFSSPVLPLNHLFPRTKPNEALGFFFSRKLVDFHQQWQFYSAI